MFATTSPFVRIPMEPSSPHLGRWALRVIVFATTSLFARIPMEPLSPHFGRWAFRSNVVLETPIRFLKKRTKVCFILLYPFGVQTRSAQLEWDRELCYDDGNMLGTYIALSTSKYARFYILRCFLTVLWPYACMWVAILAWQWSYWSREGKWTKKTKGSNGLTCSTERSCMKTERSCLKTERSCAILSNLANFPHGSAMEMKEWKAINKSQSNLCSISTI